MSEKKKERIAEELYRENGIAIYYKGRMVIGIHPDNVENNIKALDEGNLKINWGVITSAHDKAEQK